MKSWEGCTKKITVELFDVGRTFAFEPSCCQSKEGLMNQIEQANSQATIVLRVHYVAHGLICCGTQVWMRELWGIASWVFLFHGPCPWCLHTSLIRSSYEDPLLHLIYKRLPRSNISCFQMCLFFSLSILSCVITTAKSDLNVLFPFLRTSLALPIVCGAPTAWLVVLLDLVVL